MKLIYRIALRLSLILIPLMALWATLFYFMMVEEINDEADDTLEDYSELIIIRMLAGRELPSLNSGSNNSYSITPIDEAYASSKPHIEYYDAEVYIPEKEETEPARILSTIFLDNDDNYYELKVAIPTFEKDDLVRTILFWIILLYFVLLITIIGSTIWIFHVSFSDEELRRKAIARINSDLRVSKLQYTLTVGGQNAQATRDEVKGGKSFGRTFRATKTIYRECLS